MKTRFNKMTKKEQQALLNELYNFSYELSCLIWDVASENEAFKNDPLSKHSYINGAEYVQILLLNIFNEHGYKQEKLK
jgi:hypothetical protein